MPTGLCPLPHQLKKLPPGGFPLVERVAAGDRTSYLIYTTIYKQMFADGQLRSSMDGKGNSNQPYYADLLIFIFGTLVGSSLSANADFYHGRKHGP
jgi:hypothetical protein